MTADRVIDADPSRSGADQPDEDDDVQDFRQIEEIVKPVDRRKSFRDRGELYGRDRDDHVEDERNAAQARQ